jgi:hypothetical protein
MNISEQHIEGQAWMKEEGIGKKICAGKLHQKSFQKIQEMVNNEILTMN